jgi:hypothetical protein
MKEIPAKGVTVCNCFCNSTAQDPVFSVMHKDKRNPAHGKAFGKLVYFNSLPDM